MREEACSTYGGEEGCVQFLMLKREGMRQLRWPRLERDNDIIRNLQRSGMGPWTGMCGLK